jgi:hypothetical protein
MSEYDVGNGTIQQDGFKDPSGMFPRRQYMNIASTNMAARGIKRNNLYLGGGHVALDLGLREGPTSQYPLNQVRESVSGHITEIDDTPGNERMLFKHKTGAGVELRPDGTVIVSSVNNTIRISGGDEKVIVEGNGEIIYNGNLKIKVAGDFDLDVGGNFNLTTGGDKIENIKGGARQTITKNLEMNVIQNKTEYVAGTMAEIILGDKTSITKGTTSEYTEGDREMFVGYKDPDDGTGSLVGTLKITAADEVFMTSDNINIVGTDITVAGDHGDIGGDNVIMHNYNMFTGHSINVGDTITVPTIYNTTQVTTGHANIPVVYGDLQGTATQAMVSNQAGLHPSSGTHAGSGYGYTAATDTTDDIDVDATTRTRVDADEATKYLHTGDRGIRNVRIDISNDLKNSIDKSTPYGNLSSRKLTTPEIRAKLRDAANLRNKDFIGSQLTEGKLSATYINKVPTKTGRVANNEGNIIRGINILPNASAGADKKVTK